MKHSLTILFSVLSLAMIQMACSLSGASPFAESALPTVTPFPSPTDTQAPPAPTAAASPIANAGNTGNVDHGGETCTYRATFLGDATIPDDSLMAAGSMFVKTWRVRNDGTCTWGPSNHGLHAMAFTGGSQMGAPSVIPLHDTVRPGETADISITLVAPQTPGTYTSSWMLRVDNDSNAAGPNIGVGPDGDQPLYARIRIGGGLTRLQFQPGTTTAIVTGELATNESRGYLLAAQQGQIIVASIPWIEQEGGIHARITTRDGVELLKVGRNTDVVVSLPATADCIVWVSAGSSAAPYHLAVTIPARISFAPGATSTSINGSIISNREVWYVLRGSAGQTVTASLDRSNVGLIIAGVEDSHVLGGMDSEDIVTSWTGTLPTTQDYIIRVSPVVDQTTYTLTVSIQ